MKFKLGTLVATRGVAELMNTNQQFSDFVSASLKRYVECDWGEMCDEDWGKMCDEDRNGNDAAVKNGEDRILASYENTTNKDLKIWIITDMLEVSKHYEAGANKYSEWDRSVTTILFPSEY